MKLDNLKTNWKKTGIGKKNQNQLLMMTKIKNHYNIKRIRLKLIIETILVLFFIAVYYDGLDGATKPLWANVLLIGATSSYILVRFIGIVVLGNPINGDNLKKSLFSFLRNLKRMAFSILTASFLFGLAIISFFTSSIDITNEKYFILAGMILTLILMMYFSSRNWFKRINGIEATLREFASRDKQ